MASSLEWDSASLSSSSLELSSGASSISSALAYFSQYSEKVLISHVLMMFTDINVYLQNT